MVLISLKLNSLQSPFNPSMRFNNVPNSGETLDMASLPNVAHNAKLASDQFMLNALMPMVHSPKSLNTSSNSPKALYSHDT